MRYTLRLMLLSMLILLFVGAQFTGAAAVYYLNGRVDSFDGQSIIISGSRFLVKEKAAYFRHVSRAGSLFEEKARKSDVRIGNAVIIHVDGTIVDKIIIEEWKR